jgi:hypothetical protein
MIPGVRASLAVDRSPEEVRELLDRKGWPWLGRRGTLGSREVRLDGNPFREFTLRVFARDLGPSRVRTWRLLLGELEDASAAHAILELELTVLPLSGGSSWLIVGGMFSPMMFHGRDGLTGQAVTRRIANEHARALLEQVATRLEGAALVGKSMKAAAQGSHPAGGTRVTTGSRRRSAPVDSRAQVVAMVSEALDVTD